MSVVDRIAARRKGLTLRTLTSSGEGWEQEPFWLGSPAWSSVATDREAVGNDFEAYVEQAYKANGVVFACTVARQMVFAQARFQWREFRDGRPGDLFGSSDLRLLENPWQGGTTAEMLARMEVDASAAGNSYWTTADDAGRLGRAATGPGRRIVHMRPDWVTLILDAPSGNPWGLDTRVVGLLYQPRGGTAVGADEVILLPSEVCHYSPLPDPTARFRGMSWMTPVLREIQADKAATVHKAKFFENGANPGMVVKFDKDTAPAVFKEFVEKFRESHQGADKAYKTLFLTGGADATTVGLDFKQLDFKATMGVGETRIAAAARVHPVIAGLSEGLQGSSLNAGNFGAARRLFVDGTMRFLWAAAAASMQTLVPPPRDGAALWYDDRDIPFLREDLKDVAEIQAKEAVTIRQLVDAGFDPAAVTRAVMAGDWSLLTHSGLYSVQLQPPGQGTPTPAKES